MTKPKNEIEVNKPKIISSGFCTCIYEPRGKNGLEGYQVNQVYRYELRTIPNKKYYKVFPDKNIPEYGEACGTILFKRYFQINPNVEG